MAGLDEVTKTKNEKDLSNLQQTRKVHVASRIDVWKAKRLILV